VCNQPEVGACVSCAECHHAFHVSCAWSAGYKFAFIIDPARPTGGTKKRPLPPQIRVTFKGHEGLCSHANCVEADLSQGSCRPKSGARSIVPIPLWPPSTSARKIPLRSWYVTDTMTSLAHAVQTALQTFVENYKQVSTAEQVFPLLRRARRLDAVTHPALKTIADAEKVAANEAKEKARLAKLAKSEKMKKQQAKRKATSAAKKQALQNEQAEQAGPRQGVFVLSRRSSSSQPSTITEAGDASLRSRRGADLMVDTSHSYYNDTPQFAETASTASYMYDSPLQTAKFTLTHNQKAPPHSDLNHSSHPTQPAAFDGSAIDPSLLSQSHTFSPPPDAPSTDPPRPRAPSPLGETRKRKPSRITDDFWTGRSDDEIFEDSEGDDSVRSAAPARKRRRKTSERKPAAMPLPPPLFNAVAQPSSQPVTNGHAARSEAAAPFLLADVVQAPVGPNGSLQSTPATEG
jgi:hypothetical protein